MSINIMNIEFIMEFAMDPSPGYQFVATHLPL